VSNLPLSEASTTNYLSTRGGNQAGARAIRHVARQTISSRAFRAGWRCPKRIGVRRIGLLRPFTPVRARLARRPRQGRAPHLLQPLCKLEWGRPDARISITSSVRNFTPFSCVGQRGANLQIWGTSLSGLGGAAASSVCSHSYTVQPAAPTWPPICISHSGHVDYGLDPPVSDRTMSYPGSSPTAFAVARCFAALSSPPRL
jgi:hypothetical protein